MKELHELINELEIVENNLTALKQFSSCDCPQNLIELKVREINSGCHYVFQCTKCGRQQGTAIKKESVSQYHDSISDIKNYDEQLYKSYYDTLNEKLKLECKSDRLNHLINNYEEIKKYELLRQQVEEPEESCFDYTKRFENDLDQLVEAYEGKLNYISMRNLLDKKFIQLNAQYYNEEYSKVDLFSSEQDLEVWLERELKNDFHIFKQVQGRHKYTKQSVRIDYVLQAREHLIDRGFTSIPFGVEVKHFDITYNPKVGMTRKHSRAIWQTITYNQSEFYVANKKVELSFSVIFSNLSFTNELRLYSMRLDKGLNTNSYSSWQGMMRLATHAKVGMLGIIGNKKKLTGWNIFFSGGTYFQKYIKKGQVRYMHDETKNNLIDKQRVGNF